MLTLDDRISMDIACHYEKVGIVPMGDFYTWQESSKLLPPGTIAYDDGMLFNSRRHPGEEWIAIYKQKGTNPNFELFNERTGANLK